MGKMKSALEIALEKAKTQYRWKNTLDEIEQKKYVRAAATLGNSFLQGKVKQEGVKESILRYPERYRKAAITSFIKQITGEMNFENTPKILQAISYLIEDDTRINACKEAEKLFYQYMAQLKENFSRLQETPQNYCAKSWKGKESEVPPSQISTSETQKSGKKPRHSYKRIRSNYRKLSLRSAQRGIKRASHPEIYLRRSQARGTITVIPVTYQQLQKLC